MENNDDPDGKSVGHQTEPCTATIIPSGNISQDDDHDYGIRITMETTMMKIVVGTKRSRIIQPLFNRVSFFYDEDDDSFDGKQHRNNLGHHTKPCTATIIRSSNLFHDD